MHGGHPSMRCTIRPRQCPRDITKTSGISPVASQMSPDVWGAVHTLMDGLCPFFVPMMV